LQNQHNKGMKKVNCNWQLNLSLVIGFVHITSLHDHHVEHQLSPDTRIFAPINCQFSDKCREAICHLVVNKYRIKENDMSLLLIQLYEYKEMDSNWYIMPLIDPIRQYDTNKLLQLSIMSLCFIVQNLEKATRIPPRVLITDKDLSMKHITAHNFSNTKHLFCLYHLSQNILKNLQGKLGKQYPNFIKDFYLAHNSLSEISTHRVEGLNNHIKTAINSSSTLLQVIEAIYQCIERETLNQQFIAWSQDRINYNNHIILQQVFPQIVSQIDQYLTLNLAAKQHKQIVQSSIY
ncbi:2236_t:CDS:2, partial [Gigaspora margarita]